MASNYLSIEISPRRSQSWLFSDLSESFELRGYASQNGSPNDRQAVVASLRELERQSGLSFLSPNGNILYTTADQADGVKRLGLTFSAGQAIRTAIIGLSEKYSLSPLRRLVSAFNTEIVLEINLQTEPNISLQLEKLTNTGFDLLVLAGGVNAGPERALRAVINNLRLLVQLRGAERPQIVYAGNQTLSDFARLELEMSDDFHAAGNIQPESGREDLSFAYPAMLSAIKRIRFQEYPLLRELFDHPSVDFLPSEYARARMGHWLEQTQTNGKGVLQIHLEPEFGQLLASRDGQRMAVWEHAAADQAEIDAVMDLLDIPAEPAIVASYMLNKVTHPAFLPATLEELSIEMAWLQARVRKMLRNLAKLNPDFRYDQSLGLRDEYEPILLSGSSFDRLPSYRHVFLTVLDSVLPTGITTLVWDDVNMLAALGVLAGADSLLSTQVVDTDVFTSLATVVTVESPLSVGQSVLRLEVDEGEGEVRQHHQVFVADLKRIEVLPDHEVRVYLSPDENSEVGMGMRGLGGWVSTPPSKLGIVVDGRGRPVSLPTDLKTKLEVRRDWLWELGA